MHHDHVGIERLPESELLLCLIADYCFSRTLSALLLTYYKADTSRLNNASLLICAFFPIYLSASICPLSGEWSKQWRYSEQGVGATNTKGSLTVLKLRRLKRCRSTGTPRRSLVSWTPDLRSVCLRGKQMVTNSGWCCTPRCLNTHGYMIL